MQRLVIAELGCGILDLARGQWSAGGTGGAVLGLSGAIERFPNTVKAYARDLKDWFEFLVGRGLD